MSWGGGERRGDEGRGGEGKERRGGKGEVAEGHYCSTCLQSGRSQLTKYELPSFMKPYPTYDTQALSGVPLFFTGDL